MKPTRLIDNGFSPLLLFRVRNGVEESAVRAAVEKNDLKDVVFRADSGDLYVATGQTLRTPTHFGLLPEPGDRVAVGGLEGTVVYTDPEWSLQLGGGTAGTIALAVMVLSYLGGWVGGWPELAVTGLAGGSVAGLLGAWVGAVGEDRLVKAGERFDAIADRVSVP